ncbi:aldose 1-epimerase [Piscinibacter sakaiensis]|uniref:aldose epimerase family protein n=1 Tax=Piscinibacter sakaiensis TaxID=1547922 RepID=UPI003AABF397
MTETITPAVPSAEAVAGRFELHAGALRLALRADLGACVAGLWHRGTPVLRSADPAALDAVSEAACFPLLPYAHRLGQRRFRFKGRDHTTAPNADAADHSLHGVGWQRRWTLESHTAQDAVMRLVHQPDADWPYAFEAIEHLNLTPNALGIQLLLTNTDTRAQPVGLGCWINFPKRARSRLHIDVGQRWENDVNGLPIRRLSQPGLDGDVSHLDFDHAFEGWSGPARVRDERFSLQLRCATPYLVLHSHPDQQDFAIAPASHLPNAIHMADPAAHGMRTLEPGESCELALQLEVAVL